MNMWQELQPGDPRAIGPYRIRGQLGVGGMGRVFLGVSEGGRPVAVKVVRADLAADPEFRTRFRREIAVARRVSSQFTAPVIDADVDSPEPWLATAFVAGPSLATAVSQHGPLPVRAVLELAAGLAEGLRAIHAAGIVHRDLKPSNVLLAPDGPRVIDFGISRAVEASALTHTGIVVGSPGFMSPEQAEGGVVGTATDIFSLGAVLAYAATGEGPFGTGSTPALVYRVVHNPPSLDRVPAEVRPLIDRCLAKVPGQRPTARELLAETAAVEPVAGWLPEPMTQTFLQLPGLFGAPAARTTPEYAPLPNGPTPAGATGSTGPGTSTGSAGSAAYAGPTGSASAGFTGPAASTGSIRSAAYAGPTGSASAGVTGPSAESVGYAGPGGSGPSHAATSAATVPPPPGPAFGQPRRDSRDARRGLRRPLAIAAVVAGLIAASTAGGMALAASLTQAPGVHAGQQAASGPSDSPATNQPPTTVAPPAAYQNTSQPIATPSTSGPATPPSTTPPPASASTSPSAPASPAPSASAPAAPASTPTTAYGAGNGGY
jgi:serine/threonine protein kinase